MVISKGLFFCPDQGLDIFNCIKDLNLFARKVLLQALLDKRVNPPNLITLKFLRAILWPILGHSNT